MILSWLWLSKVAHFIPINITNLISEVAQILIREIVRLQGVQKKIALDIDVKFNSRFWMEIFVGLDTKLSLNTSYHPQIDGKTKRVNMILEDMPRMYIMHQQWKWEEYHPLVEISYNIRY